MDEQFFLSLYLPAWLLACALAILVAIGQRQRLRQDYAGYPAFLLQRWKWVTALIATTGMTVIAPYTGDPTWDYVDALFMAALTYTTAPWSVGVLWRGLRRQASLAHIYLALVAWLFSAAWSYDGYILLRDGDYPLTWQSNLYLSSILYVSAGLLWNLAWDAERGVHFAFQQAGWPRDGASAAQFGRIVWLALPFMLLAGILIGVFLLP
ncbi:hypothetical protein [Chitinilyticum aquatile]|uniref:hypothetical protein n=1 Tax=Chitinilyticum aquatile TaxID=362520 RepID=UPI0003F667AE|nr:hypothetical protein [Chitinilyticum aquatile]